MNVMDCCRICIQNSDSMRSLHDIDICGKMKIFDKIVFCTNITKKTNTNIPQNICLKCLEDLHIAYRFKLNCQKAEAVLKPLFDDQIVTDLIMSSENGEVFKYEPPKGLRVKRILPGQMNLHKIQEIKMEPFLSDFNKSIVDDIDENFQQILNDDNYQLKIEYLEQNDVHEDSSDYLVEQIEHQNINTEEKMKKQVNSSGAFKSRNKIKSSFKPLQICDICGNTYKYKHALESHMRRHRNERPFPCEICGKSFVLNFELRRHMRTHTGDKPYGCQFCDRRFSDFGCRIKHERTHTGERPYVCDTCGKAFAYSQVLASHKLIHTGEKKFGCDECGKRFTKSHHLKTHLNSQVHRDRRNLLDNLRNIGDDNNQIEEFHEVIKVLAKQPNIDNKNKMNVK